MKKRFAHFLNKSLKQFSAMDLVFLLFVAIVLAVSGVMFEEGASASRIVAFKGIFFEPADDFPLTQIFISSIYGFLYQFCPSVPWYGIIDYSLVLFSLVFYFKLFKKSGIPVLLVLFFALSIDDLVLFSFTRSAMLIVGSAMLTAFYLLNKYRDRQLSKRTFCWIFIGLNILILLGFFNRPQAFAYLFALFLLFVLCYQLILKVEWREVKRWLILTVPGFVCLFFAVFYYFKQPEIVKESQKLAPYFYNIYGGSFHDSFKDISKGDSLTLILVKGNFVNDRKIMNVAFAERVTQHSPQNYFSAQKFLDFKWLSKNTVKFAPFYLKHHFPDMICMFALAGFLIFTWLRNRNRKALLILLYLVLCMLSLFAITNIVKMEQRIASPVFLFTFVSVLLLIHAAGINFAVKKWGKTTIIVLSLALLLVHFKILDTRVAFYRMLVERNLKLQKNLDSYYQHHTLILGNPILGMLYRDPFREFSYHGSNSYKMYEGEAIIYMPSMRKMIYNYCGSLEFEAFFDKMFEEKDQTLYLATEDWKNLVVAYMEHFYGKRYIFKEENKASRTLDNRHDNLTIYRPEKVVLVSGD